MKKMGKSRFSFSRKRVQAKTVEMPVVDPPPSANASCSAVVSAASVKAKKKTGARLWLRFDRLGQSERMECDKNAIIKRVSIPARDLRILGPVFSHSSNILAREKAMVINLEFIKAIVTAEEVLLLDPLSQEVLPFVDQLRQQLPLKSPSGTHEAGQRDIQEKEGLQNLEINAYPVLDELARNVSTKNLERVRSLKSNLTRLLARVQKVRDEIEHLLDDNEDMAHLYLTRRQIQGQQLEALMATAASNSIVPSAPHLRRINSNFHSNASFVSFHSDDDDVEDLEMLLEAYFMQLDGTRNKVLSVREYIDDTEDYVNIQLDNQRNELIQLQLTMTIASFAVAVETLIAGIFGMNIPYTWNNVNGVFWPFVGYSSLACLALFLLILGYARWKKLLGS
ncbi:magnesium transporter MRS2-4 isoform X2 [Aristolochia californica]|uniref:magnesium transporter MRS2-4 isoform X2 n=1 Tax=Aristolochia californica TaxID=171875 RepID=UPI0035D6C548